MQTEAEEKSAAKIKMRIKSALLVTRSHTGGIASMNYLTHFCIVTVN